MVEEIDFDINEYESPEMHESEQPFVYLSEDEGLMFDGIIDKYWAIAIAKVMNLTEEDLG